ncbi:MAG: hypothetical protein NW206_04705 [Hyphomonadaceae bacterium]|nr:hypothetical protein [Hyphomonadaceae bacterium]
MTPVSPPAPVVDALQNNRVEPTPRETPADRSGQATKPFEAESASADGAGLSSAKLIVERDALAQRFVSTVIDLETQEIQRRYPSDAQLAFSRAVNAYMRIKSES